MSSEYRIIGESVGEYIKSVSPAEHPLLSELRRETSSLPRAVMQVNPLQGQFMTMLVKSINAVNAIEIGVFTGYSSICIASALPEHGKLIACDINKEWTDIAQRYWEVAELNEKVELRLAPASDTLDDLLSDGLHNSFDFVFIDANKDSYEIYYEKSLELLRPGGLIMVDNVLWKGHVFDPRQNDVETRSIREFNDKRKNDPRIEMSLLPIGDGVTLIRKRNENGSS